VEEALTALLNSAAPLTALVAGRINWGVKPQGKGVPFVVLQRISGLRDMKMSGPSGLVSSRVQADCYGLTYTSAKNVARAVRDRLSGYRGTVAGRIIQGVFLDSERDIFEPAETPDKLFRTSMDFILWHDEQ
jgi:Protein of unknown function (DUF3168)